ncbi:hypothetical protein B0A48_13787 [Cryoendolithus antarcticus]|uniref:BTB domain-containing protein n=1 Tax=Cryoendolithus antarcticus TaxID=1507870 RepID=A0A1V8SN49_9PEZI|nr:hypothetical protein B0A48_13787 [Cryoendolithus antarcticus]
MYNIVTDPAPGYTKPYHQSDAGMATPIAPPAPTALEAKKSSANTTLLATGNFSNLTVVCCGREWLLHRSVVCMHSTYFMKACTGMFQEAQTRRIDLGADDPDLVHAMITFLYIDDYDEPINIVKAYPEGAVDAEPDALFHLHLNVLADKYDIAALERVTISRFHALAEANWNKPCFAEWIHQHFLDIVQPTEDNQALHNAGGSSFGFTVAQNFLAGRTWRCGGGCGTTFTMHDSCAPQKYQVPNGTPTGCPCCGALAKKLEEWDPNRFTGPGSVRLPRAEDYDLWTPY